MDFGIFLPSTNNGYILSTASPQYMPSYALNREVAVTAEATGYSFVLSMAKFRGYGADAKGFWDYARDPLAMMGPLIEATSTLHLWGAVGAPSMHPAMVARIAATFDDASGGRFGLNVVAGWNRAEYAQMGLWPSDDYYRDRYAYVEEYVDILRGLWADGRLTRRGGFFDLDDCLVQPVPEHGVTVIVPGQSTRSLDLAAAQADVNFVLGDFDTVSAARRGLRARTAQNGRSVDTAALYGVIAAQTDAEAVEQLMEYSRHTDVEAAVGLTAAATTDAQGTAASRYLEPEALALDGVEFDHPTRAAVVSGPCLFHPHLVGSYDRVAAFLADLQRESDITKTVLSFPDYRSDVAGFMANVGDRVAS